MLLDPEAMFSLFDTSFNVRALDVNLIFSCKDSTTQFSSFPNTLPLEKRQHGEFFSSKTKTEMFQNQKHNFSIFSTVPFMSTCKNQ